MLTASPIAVALPDTPEWYAARSTGLGASEIAAAAGISPYMTPLELYRLKTGETDPIEETEEMWLGKEFEPTVKRWFTRRTGLKLIDFSPPMFRHPEHGCILATPDGIISETAILECKTSSFRMSKEWGEQGSDFIPDHYVTQTQMQMAVTGATVCHVAAMFDTRTLRTYEVQRNDHLIELLIAAGEELWERIENLDPPEPSWTHPTTLRLMKEIHQTARDARVELSTEAAAAVLRREEAKRQIKELETECDQIDVRLYSEIGDNLAGLIGDGRMVKRIITPAKFIHEHVVPAATRKGSEYLRIVKADDGEVVDRGTGVPTGLLNLEQRWMQAQRLLQEAGAVLVGESTNTRSRYWRLPNGRQVRVSDHRPNLATEEWMDRDGVYSIRVDDAAVNLDVAVGSIVGAATVSERAINAAELPE